MADIVRTLEVPNRVPGKLVFGRRRILKTFAEPAEVPDLVCPPGEASGVTGQSLADLHQSITQTKEKLLAPFALSFADDELAVIVVKGKASFPIVEGNNTSSDAATTSHTINLPATIASGETLIVLFCTDNITGGVTFPAGWNEIFESNGTASLAVAWRKADGGEGGTITVTTVSSRASIHTSYRISGAADPDVTPPEINGSASGSNSIPNPGSITPTEGPDAFLAIAVYAGDGAGPETALPTGYGNDQSHATTPVHIGCGDRNAHITSENPTAFAKTGNAFWRAATIVVYPS